MILTSPIDLTKHIDLGSLNGKTVLITGGANSDGIGFGVAEAMAQKGYVLVERYAQKPRVFSPGRRHEGIRKVLIVRPTERL